MKSPLFALLPVVLGLSACAVPGVRSFAVMPPRDAAITEPHLDPQVSSLTRSMQKAINRSVNVTGSCKVQVENTPVPGAPRREVQLECVGDPRYDEQVREALRHINDQGLPRYRTMVWSPGWKGILDWSKVIGRRSSATYAAMHDDLPSQLNQDDVVVLTRKDYEALTAGGNKPLRELQERESADFIHRIDVALSTANPPRAASSSLQVPSAAQAASNDSMGLSQAELSQARSAQATSMQTAAAPPTSPPMSSGFQLEQPFSYLPPRAASPAIETRPPAPVVPPAPPPQEFVLLLDVSRTPPTTATAEPGSAVTQSVETLRRPSGNLYLLIQGPYTSQGQAQRVLEQVAPRGYWSQVVSSAELQQIRAGKPVVPLSAMN